MTDMGLTGGGNGTPIAVTSDGSRLPTPHGGLMPWQMSASSFTARRPAILA